MAFLRVLVQLAALMLALTSAEATSNSDSSVAFLPAAVDAASLSSEASASVETVLAPIDSATGSSSAFQLVASRACNETVSGFIYVMYNKNRALFDRCVNDAQYQIFPFLGTHPSAAQVQAMAISDACVAVFTGVARADPPECDITDMPLKAAVETLLKIGVDLNQELTEAPTQERFLAMMAWRRDVNLAAAAGLPCDSESELYAQYAANLATALANPNIRVLEDYTIVYQLASGAWTADGSTTFTALGSDSGGDEVVGTVDAGDANDAADSDRDMDVGDMSDSSSGSNAATPVSASGIGSSASSGATFSLAPIGAAAADSPTFALVAGAACNASVVETVYGVYAQNRNLFDACVVDSEYRIFPYTGTAPTRSQIGAIASSPACVAILTAVVLSAVPECDLSSLPMRAAAESVVKVAVDVRMYPTQGALTVPSSERLGEMVTWRRDVNLAQAAGLPCDGESQLFAEYAANLEQATTDTTVRLRDDLTVEYRLANGSVVTGATAVVSDVATAPSGDVASAGESEAGGGMTPNQVEGYVTAAEGTQGSKEGEEASTATASGALRSWDWRMVFAVVVVSMSRLALPLV